MAKLTIIVGMGGSGKSHLCQEIATSQNAHAFDDATLVVDDDTRAGFKCLGEIVARLLSNHDCVMDEPHLTNEEFRAKFKSFCDEFLAGVEQEWIFFDYDPLACINNVFEDIRNGVKCEKIGRLESIVNQIVEYKVPAAGDYPGYESPRPVIKPPNQRFYFMEDALMWLHEEIRKRKASV